MLLASAFAAIIDAVAFAVAASVDVVAFAVAADSVAQCCTVLLLPFWSPCVELMLFPPSPLMHITFAYTSTNVSA